MIDLVLEKCIDLFIIFIDTNYVIYKQKMNIFHYIMIDKLYFFK